MEGATEAIQELLLDDSAEEQPKEKTGDPKMAAASKEMSPEQKMKEASSASAGSSIGDIVYSAVKKVVTVGAIYMVGYMGWSVAWLIGEWCRMTEQSQWSGFNGLQFIHSSARCIFGGPRGVAKERRVTAKDRQGVCHDGRKGRDNGTDQ